MPDKKYRRISKKDKIDVGPENELQECSKLFKEAVKIVKDQTEFLQKISATNEAIEDTLLNVLLAIRQNEFLQAWYPAQKGHAEMKVIGSHPLGQFKQKKEEKHVD